MAEVFDFGLQQHKIKMDGKFFENNLFAVAGDTGRRLEVQLLDSNNMVQNTTGISLRLNANVAGQATYAEATLVDATKGLYELDLPNGMLIAPGNWQFQWQIIGTSGEKLHSFAFTGSIGSNLSEGGSEATNFYLNVDELKQMQDDLINGTFNSEVLETNITEKLTNLETQYAPQLAEVTAQLAQTWLNLESFPIIPPEADDTGRFKRLIAATQVGEIAFVPYKVDWYTISDQIRIDKNIHFISKGKIGYTGTRDKAVFVLDYLRNSYFELNELADGNNASNDYNIHYAGYHGWVNDNYVGVQGINLKWCTLKAYDIRNFSTGVRLTATNGDGYWFNKHYFMNLSNNRIQMDINSDGLNSWNNANYYYDTSFHYGTSHKPFLDDARMKYGVYQTLTNGNRYGGNSNIFTDFKFEAHGTFPNGFTQIYTRKAAGWVFNDYRKELTGVNMPLIVMDLKEVDETAITAYSHSNDVILNPLLKNNEPIIFINTEKIRTDYRTIARSLQNPPMYTLLNEDNLIEKARKFDDNYLGLKGFRFAERGKGIWSNTIARAYGASLNQNTVNVTGTYPIALHLENLKKGDFINIKVTGNGVPASAAMELYDKNKTILSDLSINGERVIGNYGVFKPDIKQLSSHGIESEYNYSVNSDSLGGIRILLTGNINHIEIKTTSKEMILSKTATPIKPESLYSNAKPANTFNGGFTTGEIVYNESTLSGQAIGWTLENVSGSLVWNSFGTY